MFSKLNISKQLVSKGASLVVVLVALVAAYVAVSMNSTLGWFAKNNTVTASGMITQAYDARFKVTYTNVKLTENEDGTISKDQGTSYEDPREIITGVKVPGHSVTFDITIQNIGPYAVNVTAIGLEAPTLEEDKPKIDYDKDGKVVYRYLSTELTTDVIMVTSKSKDDEGNDKIQPYDINDDSDARYLRDRDTGVADRINYFDWVDLDEGITLNPKDSITFTIEMTFVDATYDQNIFKNFADEGACTRRIFINYDE